MVFRRYELASLETLKDAEVWDEDLPDEGFLSAILVAIRATNGSTNNEENWAYELVKELAIKDGSKVLHSLTGGLEQASAFLNTGRIPPEFLTEDPGLYQHAILPAMFGRRLNDPLYGLDLGKLKNPKMFVDFDIAAVRAAHASTAFVANSGRISVILVIDEAPTLLPLKYMRKTVIEKYTSAGSGDHKVNLPVDNPYRSIIVQTLLDDYESRSLVTNIKLSMDVDAFIPIDEKTDVLTRMLAATLGLEHHGSVDVNRTHGDITMLPDAGLRGFSALLGSGDEGDILQILGGAAGNPTICLRTHAGVALTANRSIHLGYISDQPRQCIFVPFGSPLLEDAWFPAETYKKSQLILTEGGAAATIRTVVEEVANN